MFKFVTCSGLFVFSTRDTFNHIRVFFNWIICTFGFNNIFFISCDNLCFLVQQDWFEQYRERVIEAEQIILTTLDFELTVEHPYDPLASVLNKLGLSQTLLLNIAWNLISEGWVSCLYNYIIVIWCETPFSSLVLLMPTN